MQVSDMKALRSFCTNKQLLLLNPSKTLRNSLNLFSRQFHTTLQRSWAQGSGLCVESSRSQSQPFSSHSEGGGNGQDSRNAGPAWSIYNPITGKIAAQRGVKERDEQDLEPGSSSSRYDGLEEFGGETSYGNVNKGNLSSYVEKIGEVAEEKVSGGVKEGALWGVDGNQVEGSSNGDGEERLSKGKNYGGGYKNSFGTYKEGKQVFSKDKRFANVKMGVNSVNVVGLKDVLGNRKKGKNKISYVCESCGYTDGQWWGYCRECKATGSMKQFSEAGSESGGKVSGIEVSENVVRSWLPQQAGEVRPLRLTDVNRGINQLKWRIPLPGTFGCEVDRVLGGGLVPGSLVLIGGDPGVGKSTLLLQIAAIIADGQSLGEPAPVVYVSGEESVEQIGNRADRMNIGTENLFLYSSTDIEDILEKIQPLSPRALVVDSIQTVYLKGVIGSAGNIAQVKECTSALLRFAKKTNISVLLIGHVNKAGEIAGPRVLEHIVDVVLYMEGEKYSSHRLLRPVKNRFGSTDELGVFEMAQSGLQAVSNPSEIFLSEQLSDSEVLAGLAVAVVMDGSRSFLIEVQALCASGSSVARHVNGIQASKADMIISVLIKQAGLMLQQNAIFLNVVSGVTLTETAGDLAIAAAICSSFLEFPIPNNVAFIGEIGLGGELRSVPRMEKRLNTVAKLGYERCIVPKSTEKSLANLDLGRMEVIGCKNLKEMINTVFKAQQ